MNAALKEDTKKLIAEIKEKTEKRMQVRNFQKIESGDFLTGKEAIDLGLADGFGTLQKTILKDFPESTLYYIPRIDTGIMGRRYLERIQKVSRT